MSSLHKTMKDYPLEFSFVIIIILGMPLLVVANVLFCNEFLKDFSCHDEKLSGLLGASIGFLLIPLYFVIFYILGGFNREIK